MKPLRVARPQILPRRHAVRETKRMIAARHASFFELLRFRTPSRRQADALHASGTLPTLQLDAHSAKAPLSLLIEIKHHDYTRVRRRAACR